MNFNVGDRVIAEGPCDYNESVVDLCGTVICILEDAIGVEFDVSFPDGHDCGGTGAENRCRWIYEDDPVVLLDEKVPTRTKVERKCHKLWNNSRWVKDHPQLAY